jgi:Exportin 1-like protein
MLLEQTYIKEKAATLVVEIAKRDWPQQWEDLLNNLVQISLIGVRLPFCVVLCCVVLFCFVLFCLF